MFLHQRFNYKSKFINEQGIDEVIATFIEYRNSLAKDELCIVGYDTETTGLSDAYDIPFLIGIGFGEFLFAYEPTPLLNQMFVDIAKMADYVFASNATYDYNMMHNVGTELYNVRLADTMTVARLTSYADDEYKRVGLEALGTEFVHPDAKFGGKLIKQEIARINAENIKMLKQMWGNLHPRVHFGQALESYVNRYKNMFKSDPNRKYHSFFEQYYTRANYYSVYLEKPLLMINYLYDDVLIMLEYLKKALPVMMKTDPNFTTFNMECDLIQITGDEIRTGFLVDKEYLLKSFKKCDEYQTMLYKEFHELIGSKFGIMQGHSIGKALVEQFDVKLPKTAKGMYQTDEKALKEALAQNPNPKLTKIVELITELRTVDKWISTYIVGKLENIDIDGRLRFYITNSGTVSGRVTSDMQQQPKEALKSRTGEELFHPRKIFIADPGYNLVFIDFNQMELRMQGYVTSLVSEDGLGDFNLCSVFVPYGCTKIINGERVMFSQTDPENYRQWNSGDWIKSDGTVWGEGDAHAHTTFEAFPHLHNNPKHPEFKHYRSLGKRANFLKNYGGGWRALVENIGVSEEIAKSLDSAYYKAFPKVKEYQKWVERQLLVNGFVENLFGRRYYLQFQSNFYKAANYFIQGSCADLFKRAQYNLAKYIRTKAPDIRMVLPIHDEKIFLVKDEDMWHVKHLQAIMEDVEYIMRFMPMTTEVEVSKTNWAEKKKWTQD